MKNSLVVYYDILEQLEDFTDEQVGKIFRAMVDYDKNDILPNFTGAMKLAFKFIKQSLDINKEKYKNICERNRANIRKRWEEDIPDDTKNTSGKFGIPNDTKVYQAIPNDTKNTDIDIVIDNDIDNISKKVSKNKKENINEYNLNTHACVRESYDDIFNSLEVSPEVRNALIEFIRHCQLNKKIVTNDKLKNIIVRLDFNHNSEIEKVHSIRRAINGGYFDIKEEGI